VPADPTRCRSRAAVALPSAAVCAASMESVSRGGEAGATLRSVFVVLLPAPSVSFIAGIAWYWLIKVTAGVYGDEWTIDVTNFN